MEAQADLSIITLVMHASTVVQIVLVILLTFSLVSWTIIFQKWFQLRRTRNESAEFGKKFWSGENLNVLYQNASNNKTTIGPQEGIFYAGMTEFYRARANNFQSRPGVSVTDNIDRSMKVRCHRELDNLESGLSVLATIGSVSPYIGLFGTVWGIMDAFTGLGNLESASLAVVAPGIAEALVATAIGLFAAIPAVIGYNRFSYGVERMASKYENFMQELQNILGRQG